MPRVWTYANNDPINNTDPSGMCAQPDESSGDCAAPPLGDANQYLGGGQWAFEAEAAGATSLISYVTLGVTVSGIYPGEPADGSTVTLTLDQTEITSNILSGLTSQLSPSGSAGLVGRSGGGAAGSSYTPQTGQQQPQRACPAGALPSGLRAFGSYLQTAGNVATGVGVGMGIGGAVVAGGSQLGGPELGIPGAAAGVLMVAGGAFVAAEGTGLSTVGALVSAAGGDFSGFVGVGISFGTPHVPGFNRLPRATQSAAQMGLGSTPPAKAVSNALGCR